MLCRILPSSMAARRWFAPVRPLHSTAVTMLADKNATSTENGDKKKKITVQIPRKVHALLQRTDAVVSARKLQALDRPWFPAYDDDEEDHEQNDGGKLKKNSSESDSAVPEWRKRAEKLRSTGIWQPKHRLSAARMEAVRYLYFRVNHLFIFCINQSWGRAHRDIACRTRTSSAFARWPPSSARTQSPSGASSIRDTWMRK